MYTKFYQNRQSFVEKYDKNILVCFLVHSVYVYVCECVHLNMFILHTAKDTSHTNCPCWKS